MFLPLFCPSFVVVVVVLGGVRGFWGLPYLTVIRNLPSLYGIAPTHCSSILVVSFIWDTVVSRAERLLKTLPPYLTVITNLLSLFGIVPTHCLSILVVVFISETLASWAEERLRTSLFDSYNKLALPVRNSTDTLFIHFGLFIEQILDVVSMT